MEGERQTWMFLSGRVCASFEVHSMLWVVGGFSKVLGIHLGYCLTSAPPLFQPISQPPFPCGKVALWAASLGKSIERTMFGIVSPEWWPPFAHCFCHRAHFDFDFGYVSVWFCLTQTQYYMHTNFATINELCDIYSKLLPNAQHRAREMFSFSLSVLVH